MYDKVEPDCLFAIKLRAKELSVLPIVVTFATRQNRHQLDKVVSLHINAKGDLMAGIDKNDKLLNIEKTAPPLCFPMSNNTRNGRKQNLGSSIWVS